MERYKSQIFEQEDEPNEEVISLIDKLRTESFGNADQRKKFCGIITQISLHDDIIARRFIKDLGNFCSNYIMKHEED